MSVVINEKFLDGYIGKHEMSYLKNEAQNALNAIKAKDGAEAEMLATAHVLNTMNNINNFGLENILKKEI